MIFSEKMNNFRVTAQIWFLTVALVLTEQAAHNHNRKVTLTTEDQISPITLHHSGERRREGSRRSLQSQRPSPRCRGES